MGALHLPGLQPICHPLGTLFFQQMYIVLPEYSILTADLSNFCVLTPYSMYIWVKCGILTPCLFSPMIRMAGDTHRLNEPPPSPPAIYVLRQLGF